MTMAVAPIHLLVKSHRGTIASSLDDHQGNEHQDQCKGLTGGTLDWCKLLANPPCKPLTAAQYPRQLTDRSAVS